MNFHAKFLCNYVEILHTNQGRTCQGFFLISIYYYMVFKTALYLVLDKKKYIFLFSVGNYGCPGGTFLLITYYLLLITYHLLLITYNLSLITYYLLLNISFITPITTANSIVHSL